MHTRQGVMRELDNLLVLLMACCLMLLVACCYKRELTSVPTQVVCTNLPKQLSDHAK